MAYLSDIDLATLHKKRLDEKNHYKLSWYNRRFYDDEMTHEQHISLKHEEHKVKSKAGKASTTKSKAIAKAPDSCARASNEANGTNGVGVNKSAARTVAVKPSPDFYDEGYFSSPSLSRRRSGTWP